MILLGPMQLQGSIWGGAGGSVREGGEDRSRVRDREIDGEGGGREREI